MERAVFVANLDQISEPEPYDRLYFGNEFCQVLLPDYRSVDRVMRWCDKMSKPLTFVTPFVTDHGLDKLVRIFEILTQLEIEVVVNDWGVLRLITNDFSDLEPVLGRLLSGQKRDPRIFSMFIGELSSKNEDYSQVKKELPTPLKRHFRRSCIDAPEYRRFLREMGVRRVEIDHPLHGIDVVADEQLKISVYVPYCYLTTTRYCPDERRRRIEPCRRSCQATLCEMSNPSMPTPLYRQGNTLFYRNDDWSIDRFAESGIDRLVYQPTIPM